MERIKVSILVPVYNVEKYLKECLGSILGQTLKDIEVICINDGSKDDSLEILENYRKLDSRITIIDKPNSGYGHTMNVGLDKAEGEYIGIVESDDFVAAEMFETLYNVAIESCADVVKSNYYAYRQFSEPHEEFVEPLWDCRYNEIFSPMDMINIFKVQPCIWSAVYRKDFLKKNGIRFHETPGASYQDTSFAFKAWTCAERVYLIRDGFLRYRSDNENSSVQSQAKVFCICDEFKVMEDYLKRFPDKQEKVMPMLVKMKLRDYKWNYNRLAKKYRLQFMERMQEEFRMIQQQGYLKNRYLTEEELKEIDCIIEKGQLLW